MAYKLYGREVFSATVNGREFTFTCYGQNTSYGFRHICTLGYNDTEVARYIKGDIIAKNCYYNRTWESFRYQTVLRNAIANLDEPQEIKDKLHTILVEQKEVEEREQTQKDIEEFQNLWNGLSEDNKEHIRNGLGDNLITSKEQANTVVGIMKMMTLMQDLEG